MGAGVGNCDILYQLAHCRVIYRQDVEILNKDLVLVRNWQPKKVLQRLRDIYVAIPLPLTVCGIFLSPGSLFQDTGIVLPQCLL